MKIRSSSTSRYSIYNTMVTNRAKLRAVNNRLNMMNVLGGGVFNAKLTQAQGMNEIAAKQYALRMQAELKAKLENTAGSTNKIV